MRAVVIREPGGLEKLELCDWTLEAPGPAQVRVKVRACGVCYRDLVDRMGKYPFMRRPVVTGHEWGGEIVELGPGVSDFAVGDRVVAMHRPACGECGECRAGHEVRCVNAVAMYGITADGGYAEEVLAWTASLIRVPAGVPLEQACFLHCTAAVALRALEVHGGVRAGSSVLITGAAGGVGVHAVQVARALGATVTVVTRSAHKAEVLRGLGADRVLVAEASVFHKEVAAAGGVDVALDLVGAPTINASLRSLKPGGRVVLVGNVTQERVEVNPGYLIMRENAIVGSLGASRNDVKRVLEWVVSGKLRPVLAETLPLAEARRAQERVAASEVVGRLVLVP